MKGITRLGKFLDNFSLFELFPKSFSSSAKVHESQLSPNEVLDFSKPLILSKYTRLEFEQKRWGVSDGALKDFLQLQGSDYDNLNFRHQQHYTVLKQVEQSLRELGSNVTVVQRQEYDEDLIAKSSVVLSVGGDGTFLQAASKITNPSKPLIGINSDRRRSLGHLCLPNNFTCNLFHGFNQLIDGNFKWVLRKRIRLTIDCNGTIPSPISLSDEQMKFYNHLSDLRQNLISAIKRKKITNETILPVLALNEVYIGEYVASGTSYFEMKVNENSTATKHKSSGLIVSTGTGSHAWLMSHSKLDVNQIDRLLKICSSFAEKKGRSLFPNFSAVELKEISEQYLQQMVYLDPCSSQMRFAIRDPLHNQVFPNPDDLDDDLYQEWGLACKLSVRSRLWDGCVILDGNWAYGFDDGAWITLEVLDQDALRTVELN